MRQILNEEELIGKTIKKAFNSCPNDDYILVFEDNTFAGFQSNEYSDCTYIQVSEYSLNLSERNSRFLLELGMMSTEEEKAYQDELKLSKLLANKEVRKAEYLKLKKEFEDYDNI